MQLNCLKQNKIILNKIKAVKILSKENDVIKYSEPKFYWYNPESYVVYDYDLKYPIGKVGIDDNNLPMKLTEDTYIINKTIPIPHIDSK